MATFLDLGLLNYFAVIFPALIVFVIVYAVFEKFKLLGENKTLHAIIAISMSFLVLTRVAIVLVVWLIAVFRSAGVNCICPGSSSPLPSIEFFKAVKPCNSLNSFS